MSASVRADYTAPVPCDCIRLVGGIVRHDPSCPETGPRAECHSCGELVTIREGCLVAHTRRLGIPVACQGSGKSAA